MDYKIKYEEAVKALLPSAANPSSIDLVREIERVLGTNEKLGKANLNSTRKPLYIIHAIDNYGGLRFKKLEKLEHLQVGMMVQILESNEPPATWMWVEITETLIIKFARDVESINFIRIPVYL